MKIKKWLIALLVLICGIFLFSACKNYADDVGGSKEMLNFVVNTKYGGGEVENRGIQQRVSVGKNVSLSAIDTEEYAFSHWEFLNEIVSYDRKYTFKAMEDINVRHYYAVFTPKTADKVLINVLCKPGETIDLPSPYIEEDRLKISGGGYYTVGETVTLQSDDSGIGVARSFSYGDATADGPVLELTAEKNLTVTATLEKMIVLTVLPNDFSILTLDDEDGWIEEEEIYQVSAEITTEEYVPDRWIVKDVATGEVLVEENWEKTTTFAWMVIYRDISLYNQQTLELTFTNENLMPTPTVEIFSSTGDDIGVQIEKPTTMIRGRGFPMRIIPDENTYIQDIYKTDPPSEDFPYPSRIDFCSVIEIYATGGEIYVPDASDGFGDDYQVEIKTIPREKAAIVRFISDNEFIEIIEEEMGKKPSSYYAASLSTRLYVVEKNKEQYHNFSYWNNLYAIYEIGAQFSRVEGAYRKKVSDTIEFYYTVDKDTDFYLRWERKPVFDLYFDYTLTDDGTGYVASISELALYGYCPKVKEISLPYSYNGKPVKEIADFGMSAHRCAPNKLSVDYYWYVPFEKIILPYTIEKIGEKAFAGNYDLQVVLPEGDSLSYISPDAFYSVMDTVSVNLTISHMQMMLQSLHTQYIGENSAFSLKIEPDSHFASENDLAHYETLSEYICVKESVLRQEISAFELSVLYHEFFHHYQIVATTGVGEENVDTLKIKPTQEEIDGWKTPYDTTDYEAYWNHPMEVSARDFAKKLTGIVLPYVA